MKREPNGLEEEEDHDEFFDYYSRYRPRVDPTSRSVYSTCGTTSEAGTLSSSSRYSGAGSSSQGSRDQQFARRRLTIRSKSAGRDMMGDPRFQDIANVYRGTREAEEISSTLHNNLVTYEDSLSRDSGNSSGGTPEFGRRGIIKQNSVPPMGHSGHGVQQPNMGIGMSPMRNNTGMPLGFTNHITKAEVYNRPIETESFRNDPDLIDPNVDPNDGHYLNPPRSVFDTVSLHSGGRDDHNAFSYDSMSLRSLDNHLQNWSPLSEEVRPKIAAKRKFEAFQEDHLVNNGSPVSKRPCTPEHDKKETRQSPRGWRFIAKTCKLVVILFSLSMFLVLCLVCFASYKSWQCSAHRSAPIDIDQLGRQLKTGLFGQHIALEEITEALTRFTEESSRKDTLVLLLAGWLGGGKTHTSSLISKAFPVKSNVHTLLAPLHLAQQASSALDQLVTITSRSCGYNLVILDDIDTGDPTTNRLLERFLVSLASSEENKSNGTVVIATTNTGGSVINKFMLEKTKLLEVREKITGEEVREHLKEHKVEIPLVTTLADYNIPVKIIPFLPLTREHVRLCVGREVTRHHATLSAKDLSQILDQVQFFSQDFPIFAKTGCKQIAARVNLALGGTSEL